MFAFVASLRYVSVCPIYSLIAFAAFVRLLLKQMKPSQLKLLVQAMIRRVAKTFVLVGITLAFWGSQAEAGCHYFEGIHHELPEGLSDELVLSEDGILVRLSQAGRVYEAGAFRYFSLPNERPCEGPGCRSRRPAEHMAVHGTSFERHRNLTAASDLNGLPNWGSGALLFPLADVNANSELADEIFHPPRRQA